MARMLNRKGSIVMATKEMVEMEMRMNRETTKWEDENVVFQIVEENDIPTLAISYIGKTVYLMPFRGYCFQVCGSISGSGDLASTEVVGLRNILGLTKPEFAGFGQQSNVYCVDVEIFAEMAELAIYKAVRNGYMDLPNVSDFVLKSALTELAKRTKEWLEAM